MQISKNTEESLWHFPQSDAIFTAQVLTAIYLQLLCDALCLVVNEHCSRYVGVAGSGGAPFVSLMVWQQLGRAAGQTPSFSVVGNPEAYFDCWSLLKSWLWPRASCTVRITSKFLLVLCLNHLCE